MQRPVDLALGVALPVHAHITTNKIVSDWAGREVRQAPQRFLEDLDVEDGPLRLNAPRASLPSPLPPRGAGSGRGRDRGGR